MRHRAGERITSARHGSYKPAFAVTQGMADIGNALGERVLGDNCVIPDGIHDLVLVNETASVFDKKPKNREGAGTQFDIAHPPAVRNSARVEVDLKARKSQSGSLSRFGTHSVPGL